MKKRSKMWMGWKTCFAFEVFSASLNQWQSDREDYFKASTAKFWQIIHNYRL